MSTSHLQGASSGSSDSKAVRRVVVASSIGTVVEWYDFALYGAASALIFAPLFFPEQGGIGGTLASFAVFAVAFFVRPLGGLIAAHIGDKIGRKPVLIATVTLMGAATVAVGLLPTYAQIGIWAPILLVFSRLLQGLGAGAEFAGAVTAVAEYTPEKHRGFYTSFAQASVGLAITLSTGVFALLALMPRDILLAWAWRIPFLASAVLFLVAVYIRRRIEETPEFVKVQNKAETAGKPERVPLFTAIKESPRALIIGILCGSGLNVFGYLVNTFALSYMVNTLKVPALIGTLGVVAAAGSSIFTIPFFGRLSDRVGRRPVFIGGAIFSALFVFPFFLLLGTREPWLIVMAMALAYGIGQGAMLGAQSAFLSELFPTRYRFTAIAASREVNAMALGGTTPFIATALVSAAGGSPWMVVVFVLTCLAVTIGALAASKSVKSPAPQTALQEA
ncbi:MFS transporter [Paenarthrobacter nitroguajacolicus]|uniref:MFS transporter n=1 Tax=Paenarthrobacter nitroguajacolicus TaxID=211146 RepID=UPI0015BB4910|nr:MFS transporter [Paenarthrobacter nitroguajacolicus]NWL10330.1 MFS transporter [Paenarthrobacter nitroguajacolicus]